MMLYPDAQDKAQKEVDTLIAREERLPTLKDRKDLPYLEAVLKEVSWRSSIVLRQDSTDFLDDAISPGNTSWVTALFKKQRHL